MEGSNGTAITKINRLILVGNGFDLAHGLKTSYNDFLVWYLKTVLTKALEDRRYNDALITISDVSNNEFKRLQSIGIHSVDEFVDYFYRNNALHKLTSQTLEINGRGQLRNPFNILYDLSFLQELINRCTPLNWVDIEGFYFETLVHYFSNSSPKSEKNLTRLNDLWKCLITHLQEYLKGIKVNREVPEYEKILYAPLDAEEFVDNLSLSGSEVGETLILNFNYTSTIVKYTKAASASKVDVNYIHGELNNAENKLIFGYGDELDNDYLKFEDKKSIGQYDYIKSFWYFKTSNYYDFLRFIDSNDYQVYILGHSCGLSDRTMLNMIFEHDNCKSIKIFYHGTEQDNNYTAITHEISRHFKDKPKMRRRIVSLDKSKRMPQYNNK